MEDIEIWKKLELENISCSYSISSYGNFRNDKTMNILKQFKKNGYKCMNVKSSDGKTKLLTISRIVAQHFIENNDKTKNVVNHIDGNKENNHVSNLEWVNQKENIAHANETGLIKHHTTSVYQYDMQGNFIRGFDSVKDGAESIKLTHHAITKVLTGKNKSAGGYFWTYKKPVIKSLDGYVHAIIKEYPKYSITTCGNVYSHKNKRMLELMDNDNGYNLVTLMIDNNKQNYYVHRLVAEAFIENNDEIKKFVNHKDGNKKNNCVDNLEWVNCSENMKHFYSLKRQS